MKKAIMTGASVFLLGLILTIIFAIFPIFLINEEMMLWGMRAGFILMGIGAIILITFLSIERVKDNKKLKKDIKEKDLRP
ncbi:MAG: hypothetical protein KAI62_07840 [Actinomycetia bacterium]|nr:hypothetical protein [Actinomycetes bacterium]